MKCNNCSTPIPEGAVFCPNCGSKSDATVKFQAGSPFRGSLSFTPANQDSADQQPLNSAPAPEPQPVPSQPAPQPTPMPFGAEPVNPQPDYTDSYTPDSFGAPKGPRKRFPVIPIVAVALVAVIVVAAASFLFSGGMGGGK